jgi:hypothetical protein
MHLFFVDQYIALDTLSPIAFSLAKKEKVLICNLNPLQNLKSEKLLNFLKNNNILYFELFDLIKSSLVSLIKFFFKFPKCIICLRLFNILYKFFDKNICIINSNDLKNLLIKNKVKSVTVEDGLPNAKLRLISAVCKKLNISLILVPSGINAIKLPKLNVKDLNLVDYYLSPNYLRNFSKSLYNKNIVKILGSPRFSDGWIRILDKIYNKKFFVNKNMVKIGFFLRPGSPENKMVKLLIEKIKNIKKVKCEIRDKPRDLRPNICTEFYYNNMNSSEIIKWSDLIITARASSILVEAVKRNKIIIIPTYLNPLVKYAPIVKYKAILKYNKETELLEFIENFSNNKTNNNLRKYKNNFTKQFVGNFYDTGIFENYINFYKKL